MLRRLALSIRIRIGVDHAVKRCTLPDGTRRGEHTRRREQRESHERGTGDWLQNDILLRRTRSVDADIVAPRRSQRCKALAYFPGRSAASPRLPVAPQLHFQPTTGLRCLIPMAILAIV